MFAKAALVLRGQGLDEEPTGFDFGHRDEDTSPRETPLTRGDVKRALAAQAKLFFIDDDSVAYLTACAIENEYPVLVRAVMRLCHEESLRLAYHRDDGFIIPTSVRAAVRALQGKPVVLLRLVDKRSTAVLHLELQAWTDHGDHIMAPKSNYVSRRVWMSSLEAHDLPRKGEVGHLAELLGAPVQQVVPFDVDFVYTWVDSHDPEWQKMYAAYRPDVERDGTSLSRFFNRNELMFSLRALEMYAPWVRRIHIVSNCRAPRWLDVDHPRIHWVDHTTIFDPKYLPTFSSHAIETRLHKIPGLSDHFVYSNDDFLLTRPARKNDFFESNGICRLKLEDWGSVNGKPRAGEPDYLNGARNVQALIERDFGVSPTQLHTHSPQALRVDILEEMEAKYGDAFERTMAAKFRQVTDVAVTGFFFHHYAYVTGRALKSDAKTLLIQQNHNFRVRYRQVLAERDMVELEERHLSVCVNDGADSHLNVRWNKLTSQFLRSYFPEKCAFER
ncbi:MAG: stealth conserved region 3 domain-containing protein [Myxococcota bacterium]